MSTEEIHRKATELDWLIQAYAISKEGHDDVFLVKKIRRSVKSILDNLSGRIVVQRWLSGR